MRKVCLHLIFHCRKPVVHLLGPYTLASAPEIHGSGRTKNNFGAWIHQLPTHWCFELIVWRLGLVFFFHKNQGFENLQQPFQTFSV